MADWVEATLLERIQWDTGLCTLRVGVPRPLPFRPGQFTNLGLEGGAQKLRRAYSIASEPGADPEFYIKEVPGGALSPALLQRKVGDSLWVDLQPAGFFTLDWLPEQAKELWLVGTGTGLGPYVSMLRAGALFPRFERVVIVHGVRVHAELGYRRELELAAQDERVSYRPLVTREPAQIGVGQGRIPDRIADGTLEQSVGMPFDHERSHFLLCGNPEMIATTTAVLDGRGFRKHKRKEWGHVTTEKYW
jgi:ferredoxin/flavodoxin---NADP+ reductase